MIAALDQIKARVTEARKVTRADMQEAITAIKAEGANVEDEISEMVQGVYNADQTAKLLTSLDSYN